MNRNEAYNILCEELESVRNMGLQAAKDILSTSNEFTRKRGSGAVYCVAIKLEDTTLLGTIHDNNSFRFEMLEEAVYFNNTK